MHKKEQSYTYPPVELRRKAHFFSFFVRYITNDIKQPKRLSDFNHITSLGSQSADGRLTYSFKRPLIGLDSADDKDIEITSSEQHYLLFAHGSTAVTDNTQYDEDNMRYHGPRQRWYSSEEYCLAQWCGKLLGLYRA